MMGVGRCLAAVIVWWMVCRSVALYVGVCAAVVLCVVVVRCFCPLRHCHVCGVGALRVVSWLVWRWPSSPLCGWWSLLWCRVGLIVWWWCDGGAGVGRLWWSVLVVCVWWG